MPSDEFCLKDELDCFSADYVGGCDEVGRGPLVGPVVAASVNVKYIDFKNLESLLVDLKTLRVTDSKKLNTKKRLQILEALEINLDNMVGDQVYNISFKNYNLNFCIQEVSAVYIDKINILNASLLAMKNSFLKLNFNDSFTQLMLIDGNKLPGNLPINFKAVPVIKGDSKVELIGLASIIAKEYRDNLMAKLHVQYPDYQFNKNAGYPTELHRQILKKIGPCPYHRKTFKGVKEFV